MIKALLFILTLCLINEANALLCSQSCGTGNCSELSYFLTNCAHCDKVQVKCITAFCKNHPNLCDSNVPLHNLSINTNDISSDDKVLDVCMARLFPEMTFHEHKNGDLTIIGLNTLDITTFAQTAGSTAKIKYDRNLGIIKSLMANYLVYKNPKLKDDPILSTRVDQELTASYIVNIDHLTLQDFHRIAEDLRSKIFKAKGIKVQFRYENYKDKMYHMTVSELGCQGEKSATEFPYHAGPRVKTAK